MIDAIAYTCQWLSTFRRGDTASHFWTFNPHKGWIQIQSPEKAITTTVQINLRVCSPRSRRRALGRETTLAKNQPSWRCHELGRHSTLKQATRCHGGLWTQRPGWSSLPWHGTIYLATVSLSLSLAGLLSPLSSSLWFSTIDLHPPPPASPSLHRSKPSLFWAITSSHWGRSVARGLGRAPRANKLLDPIDFIDCIPPSAWSLIALSWWTCNDYYLAVICVPSCYGFLLCKEQNRTYLFYLKSIFHSRFTILM